MMKLKKPVVNKDKTREAVEAAFEAYRMYKSIEPSLGFFARQAGIRGFGPRNKETASYPQNDADMIRGGGGKQTFAMELSAMSDAVAQYNVERETTVAAIDAAVATLTPVERRIVECTLKLDPDARQKNSLIAESLGIGTTKYNKVKWSAIERIAFALHIVVLDDQGTDGGDAA